MSNKTSGRQVFSRRVVLTGGAIQLNGAREVAARILSKQVRLGKPMRLAGLPEASSSVMPRRAARA